MSKKSLIARQRKRIILVLIHSHNRYVYRTNGKDEKSFEKKLRIYSFLQKLPRNSLRCRLRNRCYVTGRSRGYFRTFGLSRHILRDMAHYGLLPGVTKASW